ncbi:MAG TPA: cytochrome c [Candidatus Acidoferrales bacterium]|nr:cytochrome c [Candidatus Acidoferrales bacterium]
MKGFMLGVLVTLFVAIGAGLYVAETGRMDMRADQQPSATETRLAMHALDESVDRSAPHLTNPRPPTEANLVHGATIYLEHCAMCHGDPVHTRSPLADTLNPPAPQFAEDAPDMPAYQNYYITAHGIRWTGMPGWKNVLRDDEIWDAVTFLSHMGNLPPAAKSIFALNGQTTAAPGKRTK